MTRRCDDADCISPADFVHDIGGCGYAACKFHALEDPLICPGCAGLWREKAMTSESLPSVILIGALLRKGATRSDE